MKKNQSKPVECHNPECRQYLCHRTDEFLIVDDLEVVPKIEKKIPKIMKDAKRIKVRIFCYACSRVTRVYLKKQIEPENSPPGTERKFSIFRSRF